MFRVANDTERATSRRRGYTLVEMLIVCAVLAALAGMSWPAMRGMLTKARLQEAADALQTTLRKTRIQAVRSGAVTVIQYEPGGTRYRTGDWEAAMLTDGRGGGTDDFSVGAEPAFGDQVTSADAVGLSLVEYELPVGVRFARQDDGIFQPGLEADTANEPETTLPSDNTLEPQWADPIVFRANGRSDDADIRLIDQRSFVVDVQLRGLTGTVTATAARRFEPAFAQQDDRTAGAYERTP